MFNKKDMSVSLLVAEEKVKEVRDEYDGVLDKLIIHYSMIVNNMKDTFPLKLQLKLNGSVYDIGKKTTLTTRDDIPVYTGDEILMEKKGRRGFVFIDESGVCKLITNGEVYLIRDGKKPKNGKKYKPVDDKGIIYIKDVVISKHFNTYSVDDEIAKGRNGGEGAIVQIAE